MTSLIREQAEMLAREGLAALRVGDAARARDRFDRIVAQPLGQPLPWFPLAQACRLLGEGDGERRALQAQLNAEPRHLAALAMMADLEHRSGDMRAAMSFYRTALAQAAAPGTTVPPALVPLLRQGETVVAEAQRQFAAHLDDSLHDAAALAGSGGVRLREAMDLLLGRRELYLQQPSMLYFPGLPQRAFYERSMFDWVPALEERTAAIRAELTTILAEDSGFPPYVEGAAGRPRPNNPLFGDPSWGAFHILRNGVPVVGNASRCPETLAALEGVPAPVIAQRSPMALFSLLRAGTHIQPHHGLLNTRLICHLPLIVPLDCALRVGSETRVWRPGELMIFDDSFEHEAWNRSDTTRVVLLFEIWRPELSAQEREGLTRIFEAIDTYDSGAFAEG